MALLWLISAVLQALRHMYGVLPCTASIPSYVLIVQHYTVTVSTEVGHRYLKFCTWHTTCILLTTYYWEIHFFL